MALPEFTMRQLLEAGVHFGHKTDSWNPKMAPYIFGERSGIHIMDLSQTVPLLHQALKEVHDVAARNGRILFVGTKRNASDSVAYSAKRCGQFYVNSRWLGGMLTNWQAVTKSISRLKELEALLGDQGVDAQTGLSKKDNLKLDRERQKLEKVLGGIKDMGGKPDLMFVIDTNKENIAIKEARRMGIPVIAILDTNSDPKSADIPIPGNHDAARAIKLYCELVADAILDGMTEAKAIPNTDLVPKCSPLNYASFLNDAQVITEKAFTPNTELVSSYIFNEQVFATARDTKLNTLFEINWTPQSKNLEFNARWACINSPINIIDQIGSKLVSQHELSNLKVDLFLNDSFHEYTDVDHDLRRKVFRQNLIRASVITPNEMPFGLRLYNSPENDSEAFEVMATRFSEKSTLLFIKQVRYHVEHLLPIVSEVAFKNSSEYSAENVYASPQVMKPNEAQALEELENEMLENEMLENVFKQSTES